MPVSYITYKGKQILYVDYRNMVKQDELMQNLELQVKIFKESPGKILSLADMRGAIVNNEFMNKIKKYGKEVFSKKTEKAAILGITGVKKVLLTAYNKFSGDSLVVFDSEEEAKEFLIS